MKNVFITGISKGLGIELTKFYLKNGCRVFGVSRTMTRGLEHLMEKYQECLVWKQFDLSRIDNLECDLESAMGFDSIKIDIFIDNAAILYKDLIHRIKADELAKMVAINVTSPIIVTKMIVKNFLRYKTKGCIVHVSSICAHRSFNGLSMIGATKAAIETFSQDTAYEYGRFGIRSNTVVLGLMEIGMKSTVNDKLTENMKSIAAMKKLIDTDSVVKTIDFLTSDSCLCITGENININGGIL